MWQTLDRCALTPSLHSPEQTQGLKHLCAQLNNTLCQIIYALCPSSLATTDAAKCGKLCLAWTKELDAKGGTLTEDVRACIYQRLKNLIDRWWKQICCALSKDLEFHQVWQWAAATNANHMESLCDIQIRIVVKTQQEKRKRGVKDDPAIISYMPDRCALTPSPTHLL